MLTFGYHELACVSKHYSTWDDKLFTIDCLQKKSGVIIAGNGQNKRSEENAGAGKAGGLTVGLAFGMLQIWPNSTTRN